MAVDQSEILKEAVTTLRDDATLLAILGEATDEPGKAAVYNHVPQDDAQPYLAIKWQADEPWDTKNSRGFDGSLNHEVVTIHHGDRNLLMVLDRIRAIYIESPLVLVSGSVVCLEYQSGSVASQVLETHRGSALYSVLVDEAG